VNVAIVDYGAGNRRSVALAFERLGSALVDDCESAELVVLPGVGSAASAMAQIRRAGLNRVLRARLLSGRPVLGICLGLQLALEATDEDGGVDGLALLPGRAVRLRSGLVPRIGWAPVEPGGEAFYFAHSYAAETPSATAWSEGIVAEARLGSFTGVQFHPEKSGRAGARYLSGYLARIEEQCLSRA
jgi:imidazole glycerol phosphate synthase glutamine amidotransferase subunit